MIDLHLHTTASDGVLSPSELVARARAAHLSIIAITDHDTTAGTLAARDAARAADLELIAGIEISAVQEGRDVHMLGYFIDAASPALERFLAAQRQQRIDRIRRMVAKLAPFGIRLDADAIEVYHTDHDRAATARYRALADRLKLLASGGSDFHGDQSHGAASPGTVTLPREDFDRLASRALERKASEPPRR